MAVLKLGGRKFDLGALTLDQLQQALPHIDASTPLTADGLAAIKRLLSIALQTPEEEIGKLPVTLEELWEAQKQIAEVSGLRPLLMRLEAEKAARRSPGTASTPGSQPTPAGTGQPSAV